MVKNLRNPEFKIEIDATVKQKIIFLFKSYLLTFLFTVLSFAIIIVVEAFIVDTLHQKSIWNEIKNSNIRIKSMFGNYSYLMIAIIIPLIEETIFRLPLNLKKSSIAISISILYLRFSDNFLTQFIDITKIEDIFKIVVSIIIYFLVMVILKQEYLNKLKREHYKIVFYLVAISFGLIHITNFHDINYSLLVFYPFYVLPQLFMGILIGNIRIKYGFIWGWALHGLINSTSFLLP